MLSGDAGNDALVGGSGNDALFGGAGSDSYLFDRGFGHDRISDYVDAGAAGDIDEIVFGAGISATELQLSRIGDDLRVALGDGTDAVTVASYFVSHSQGSLPNAIERIRFADGTVWNQDDVAAAVGGTPANAAPPAQAASAAYAPEADKPMSWREWSAHQPSETVVRRELQSLIVAMGQPLAVAPATRDAQADSTAGLLGVASGFAEFEHTQRSAGGLVL
ncbi:hypothetical protein J5226_13735 [Lysobacter sp. K5869]|nr:hypothetical protein J5226_13735 [Lysobacter sp. K5869]